MDAICEPKRIISAAILSRRLAISRPALAKHIRRTTHRLRLRLSRNNPLAGASYLDYRHDGFTGVLFHITPISCTNDSDSPLPIWPFASKTRDYLARQLT